MVQCLIGFCMGMLILCSVVVGWLVQCLCSFVMIWRYVISVCSLVVELRFSLMFLLMLNGLLNVLVCISMWLLFGVCLQSVKLYVMLCGLLCFSIMLLMRLVVLVCVGLCSLCNLVEILCCNGVLSVLLVVRFSWLSVYMCEMLSMFVRLMCMVFVFLCLMGGGGMCVFSVCCLSDCVIVVLCSVGGIMLDMVSMCRQVLVKVLSLLRFLR